jgi:DNA-binding NarL/FixJ family response regulator
MDRDLALSSSANPAPTILIASEIRLFGEGLAKVLAGDPTVSVAGYCLDAADLMLKTVSLKPDIILLDAGFQPGRGLVAQLKEAAPAAAVVVIALIEAAENVLAWLEAGAAGYISNATALADLPAILVGVSRGEQTCLPSVTAALIRRLQELGTLASPWTASCMFPSLTSREVQIAELIDAGMSNKEIARHLKIGVSTTKSHVHNLLGKLKVQQRAKAAVRLRRSSPPP